MPIVLTIDNSKSSIQNVDDILKSNKFNHVFAENGKTGLKHVRTFYPDLILLEIKLSDMSGFDVLGVLKNSWKTRRIPVVILTELTDKEHLVIAMKLGVIDYITKPFEKEIFEKKINTALKYSKIQRNKILPEDSTNMLISRQYGKTIITYKNILKADLTFEETKKLCDKSFAKKTRHDELIIDIRYLNNYTNEDSEILNEVISLFAYRRLFFICGRYYNIVKKSINQGTNLKLFISYGDMEVYVYKEK